MSNIGKLSKEDLKKVGIGALVAGAGAIVTYLVSWAGSYDFGTYTPIVVAVSSIAVNFIRKWLLNTSQ